MKTTIILFLAINTAIAGVIDNALKQVELQLSFLVENTDEARAQSTSPKQIMPRSLKSDGSIKMVNQDDWCSGFYPGTLWQMYRITKADRWRREAARNTALLEQVQHHSGSHDIGFMICCSFGNGYELTKDETYRNVILTAANTLTKRFSPTTGCILSWSWGKDKWKFPVIIDNMMNLELLYQASLLSGDKHFYDIALSHATRTLENHFRADNSTYHVVDYDPENGSVRRKMTFQGHHDESVWSRGQGWALYGFTMSYRYTHNRKFLKKAQHIADFFFSQKDLPEDFIPYWDMKDPNIAIQPTLVPRDASAAAIMASALYELAEYSSKKVARRYRGYADKILASLCTKYLNELGTQHGFLLSHSTGNWPAHDEIDVPLNYADYYFLEAISRSKNSLR